MHNPTSGVTVMGIHDENKRSMLGPITRFCSCFVRLQSSQIVRDHQAGKLLAVLKSADSPKQFFYRNMIFVTSGWTSRDTF